MINLEMTAASRVGCVRPVNEDLILVGRSFIRDDKYQTEASLSDTDRYLICLADGMGGHSRGDVASSDTLHNFLFFFHDIPSGLSTSGFNEIMVDWLESINNYLASKGRADAQFKGMGTTMVGLAYYEGAFYTLNCGDSRLYRLRDSHLTQLTTDHSLSNILGDEKHSSVITNCIGGGCDNSFIDVVLLPATQVESGDCYLLCSDGLTDMIAEDVVAELLRQGADADALCDAAIAAGGVDNVSACIVKIK